MLRKMYKFVTPWGIAGKKQILANRILGVAANYTYPVYCKFRKIKKKDRADYRDQEVIVSLTSFPARIESVYLCINSILRQTMPADRVILWLADSQFSEKDVPEKLRKLEKKGLEIRFCQDIKSYKKVFFTAQEFAKSIIITADDDVLYPEDWVEGLLRKMRDFPGCVICYRAHEMVLEKGQILPYKSWKGLSIGTQGPSLMLVPTGVGGVLYPPSYFEGVEFDFEKIKQLCPTADDLWLKFIGLDKKIEVVKVFPDSKEWFTLRGTQESALYKENTQTQNLNEAALQKLIKHYQINLME